MSKYPIVSYGGGEQQNPPSPYSNYSTASSSYYTSGYDCDNSSVGSGSCSGVSGSGYANANNNNIPSLNHNNTGNSNYALQLLQEESGVINSDVGVNSGVRKSKHKQKCEVWARSRANQLMEETSKASTGTSKSTTTHQAPTGTTKTMSAKEAAAKLASRKPLRSKPMKSSDTPIGLANFKKKNPFPKKATTTRKLPEKTPEDVRDPETIPGMKCQLHLDREKDAEKKANKLLIDISNYGIECMI